MLEKLPERMGHLRKGPEVGIWTLELRSQIYHLPIGWPWRKNSNESVQF